MKKEAKKEKNICKSLPRNIWCISIMAIAIIVLTWLSSSSETWSKVVVTILAALIFVRSIMVNCCN